MAAAAYGIGRLGSQLHSRRACISAGLVFAALPQVSRYGQEARPYALVVAVAVFATYLLLRALANPGRGSWIAYACAVSLLGLLNLVALLLLLAHAVLARRQARVWLTTAALACIPAVPILALAVNQQDQLSWVCPHWRC
jgi:mannosyltransferase